MQHKFTLFQTPLDLAHTLWQKQIQSGDIAIDATCGNGHDSLFLSQLPLSCLHLFDIQQAAIAATQERLRESLIPCHFHCQSHETMDQFVENESISLIVFNLGYLPGSDKSIKTDPTTTLRSAEQSLQLLKKGGTLSITCYPGHPEGQIEEHELLAWAKKLPPATWCVTWIQFQNRTTSPSLLVVQKSL